MEDLDSRELELVKRHEEIILRREALSRGTETYYNLQDRQAATFLIDYAKAKERNTLVLEQLDRCRRDLKRELQDEGTARFNALKNNYWSMVRSVFPVWLEEQREYERKHGGTTQYGTAGTAGTTQLSNRASPRPPSRNLVSSREMMSTDTLETVPQLDLDDGMDDTSRAFTPQPPTSARGGTPTPRSASGRKTPKKVSYPGEENMESTRIYDVEDAPSLSNTADVQGGSKKDKGKGKGKKSKEKMNKAEKKKK